jgi:two-component system response regulator AtoC
LSGEQTAEVRDLRIVVLVVDDDSEMRRVLRRSLESEGHSVLEADNGKEALRLLEHERVDVVLSDVRMPGLDGMALLRQVAGTAADVPVVLMTAFGSVEDAVAAMKDGAADYVRKPFELDEVLVALKRAVRVRRERRELRRLRKEAGSDTPLERIIGDSPAIRQLLADIHKIGASDANVIVSGESGTGKELVARALHHVSPRSSGPFLPVNCSAIPETLFESEFFGHVKGAFTGASHSKPGLFEEADTGTLFLDEISTIPESGQAKLLRVLEDGILKRVGATQARPVDVRLISATNVPLQSLVHDGMFRSDLYYRLNVVTLAIPPLRDRPSDIPLLVEHFLFEYGQMSQGDILDGETTRRLTSYPWPGNVRELENVVQRALVMREKHIGGDDLPQHLRDAVSSRTEHPQQPSGEESPSSEMRSLEELEWDHIQAVLQSTGGNRAQASRILRIDRRTLQRKLKKMEDQADA